MFEILIFNRIGPSQFITAGPFDLLT